MIPESQLVCKQLDQFEREGLLHICIEIGLYRLRYLTRKYWSLPRSFMSNRLVDEIEDLY